MTEKIPKAKWASKQQFKDNKTAEDIREKAMDRLKETKKRNSDEGGASPKRHRTTGRLFREKTAADREIKQQKLRAKQQEQESQQQMMKAMMI